MAEVSELPMQVQETPAPLYYVPTTYLDVTYNKLIVNNVLVSKGGITVTCCPFCPGGVQMTPNNKNDLCCPKSPETHTFKVNSIAMLAMLTAGQFVKCIAPSDTPLHDHRVPVLICRTCKHGTLRYANSAGSAVKGSPYYTCGCKLYEEKMAVYLCYMNQSIEAKDKALSPAMETEMKKHIEAVDPGMAICKRINMTSTNPKKFTASLKAQEIDKLTAANNTFFDELL